MPKKWQYHVSGALRMAQCGYRWYRENVMGIRTPTNTTLAVGTGVDRSVGSNLAVKIDTGELLPLEQCRDIARDRTAKRLDHEEFRLDEDEVEGGREAARGAALDRAVKLAGAHREQVAPWLYPTHVAQEFVIDVEGYDYQLVGEKDIREMRPSVGAVIRDTKTRKGKQPDARSASNSTQLTMYSLAEFVDQGAVPAAVALDFLVSYKKRPGMGLGKTRWLEAEKKIGRPPTDGVHFEQISMRSLADFRPLLDRFALLDEARRKGVFYPDDPSRPGNWACSKKFCPHWDNCPYVRNPVTAAVPAGLVALGGKAA